MTPKENHASEEDAETNNIPDSSKQLLALYNRITTSLIDALSLNATLARDFDRERANKQANALAHDLELLYDFDLDLAHSLALDRDLDLERASTLDRALTRALTRALERALYRVQDMVNDLTLDAALELALDLEVARARVRDLALDLDLELDFSQNVDCQLMALESRDDDLKDGLTPAYLLQTAAPYIAALANLQQVLYKVAGQVSQPIKVLFLEAGSLNVTLQGADVVLDKVHGLIAPWRDEHGQALAALDELHKRTDIKVQRTSLLHKHSGSDEAQDKIDTLMAETKRLRVEAEQMNTIIHHARIELALQILNEVNAGLSESERLDYTMQILPPLKVLTDSPLYAVDAS